MRSKFRVTYTDGRVEVIEADFHDHDTVRVGAEHIFTTLAPRQEHVIKAAEIVSVQELTPHTRAQRRWDTRHSSL